MASPEATTFHLTDSRATGIQWHCSSCGCTARSLAPFISSIKSAEGKAFVAVGGNLGAFLPASLCCEKRRGERRWAGISTVTFYKWKAKYEGMEISEMRRLRLLEEENGRLKKIVVQQALE